MKNTSSINVKDAAFRWYMSRGGGSYCFVVIQRVEGHGTKLLVRVPGRLDRKGQCERPILPSLMEKCIEAAFRAGWNPDVDGPDFRVTLEGLLPDEPTPLTKNELEIGELDKELQANPNNAAAYRRRGVCWFIEDEYEKAIADFSEAIELNPGAADVLIDRGRSLDHKGEYDKAVADFSEAIRLDPKSALAHYYRGRSRYDRGEYGKAIEDFTESIRLDPTGVKRSEKGVKRGRSSFLGQLAHILGSCGRPPKK
ncbi:MAG: tetratricopeptide repeat protein [Planctomycetes bacterium]|nr:tetratricopeptide repeat protein [Planctomycetota bacterium]